MRRPPPGFELIDALYARTWDLLVWPDGTARLILGAYGDGEIVIDGRPVPPDRVEEIWAPTALSYAAAMLYTRMFLIRSGIRWGWARRVRDCKVRPVALPETLRHPDDEWSQSTVT